MNFKKAFTLVEILLTLAIVGSVAILAVTNVTNSSDEATRIAKLRSTYSLLNAAYNKALAENNASLPLGVASYLKTSKICRWDGDDWIDDVDECFDTSAKSAYGEEIDDRMAGGTIAVLSNGVSVWLNYIDQAYIDVDGPNKGNNVIGEDIFHFSFSDGFEPLGYGETFSTKAEDYRCPYNGDNCTAWALKMGNTDYLKCPGDLAWNDPAKVKCPK